MLVEKCSEEYEHSLNHHPHVILSHEDEEEDMVHHDHADHDHVGHFSSLLEVGTIIISYIIPDYTSCIVCHDVTFYSSVVTFVIICFK